MQAPASLQNFGDRRGTDTAANNPERHYAFVAHIEVFPDCWIVDLETIGYNWFRSVWAQFLSTANGSRMASIIGARDFGELYPRLSTPDLSVIYDVHVQYHLRTLYSQDPAPVSVLQTVLPPDSPVRESNWYVIELSAPVLLLEPRGPEHIREVVQNLLSFVSPDRDQLVQRNLERVFEAEPNIRSILHALYYPHAVPEGYNRQGSAAPEPSDVPRGTGKRGGAPDSSTPKRTRMDSATDDPMDDEPT